MPLNLSEDTADLKFDLFIRSREMEQIAVHLESLMLKHKKEREIFVKENRAYLETLMPLLVENSNLSLEGMQLDREAAALSMQLAVNLRKSLSLINALFYGVEGLKS
jgi:hypothetical protein